MKLYWSSRSPFVRKVMLAAFGFSGMGRAATGGNAMVVMIIAHESHWSHMCPPLPVRTA